MVSVQTGRFFSGRTVLFGKGVLLALLLLPSAATVAVAQAPGSPTGSTTTAAPPATGSDARLSAAQLQTLVGRIALYPDDLLAIVLPASTQPLQVVEAQRFLDERRSNPKLSPPLSPSKTWDPSVVALLNYPEALKVMNDDLEWTQQLGIAVVNQQGAVMDAVQGFRQRAHAAGNLSSNDKQTVTVRNKTIVVQSAEPDVVYVPSYNPSTVVYVTPPAAPPPYYWSPPYPYYYDAGAAFFTGAVFGTALGYALSWDDHDIYHGDVNINRNVNINTANVHARVDRIAQNRENRWHSEGTAAGRAQARLNRPAVPGRAGAPPSAQQIRSGLSGAAGRHPELAQHPAQRPAGALPHGAAAQAHAGRFGGEGFAGHNAFAGIDHGALAEHQSLRGFQSLEGAGGFHGGGFQGGGFHGGGFHGGGFHRR